MLWAPCLKIHRGSIAAIEVTTREGYEIDFVAVSADGSKELIQAVWDASDQRTREREERALAIAEKELGISGRIVSARDYLRDLLD